jgi:hypothetical protein
VSSKQSGIWNRMKKSYEIPGFVAHLLRVRLFECAVAVPILSANSKFTAALRVKQQRRRGGSAVGAIRGFQNRENRSDFQKFE